MAGSRDLSSEASLEGAPLQTEGMVYGPEVKLEVYVGAGGVDF